MESGAVLAVAWIAGVDLARWREWLAGGSRLALLGSAALLLFALLLVALVLLSRRKLRRDATEIVVALEEMRSGRHRRRADVDSRSPLATLAEAANRLGQDVAARWAEAEVAAEGLRSIVDAARDYAVITTDADWDIRSCGAGASPLFGWEEEEVRTRPASILFDEGSWKELLPKLARRNLRERGVEMRATMVRRDGTTFDGQVSVRVFRGHHAQEAAGFLLLVKDVGAQLRVENGLRAEEERHRQLMDRLGLGVLVVQDDAVVYANAAARRLLGGEGLVGTALRDRVATRDVLLVQDLVGHPAPAAEEPRRVRVAIEGGPADVILAAAETTHGDRPATLVTVLEERGSARIEEAFRRGESRLDAVVEAFPDGIVVLTEEGGCAAARMTNRAFLEMLSLREDEVLGAPEPVLVRKMREAGGGAEALAGLLAEPLETSRRETVPLGTDGSRIVEATVAPLVGRGGERLGRMLAVRDLTRQRVLERKLQADADELMRSKAELTAGHRTLTARLEEAERRSADLDRLNAELRTLDQMKSGLLANVSHELQTPLVAIRGYTEMILRERLGAINTEQKKGLALSLKNIDRLISMIDNLMAFARMDRDAAELTIATFPLQALVEESTGLLRARIDERRIRVSVDLEDPNQVVQGDRDKLVQVFVNLLSNAVKYNREGGEIRIEARKGKPGSVGIRVRDTGIGIPEDDLERIFDRFYRAGSGAAAEREGTGLGLAIVRNILRLHGCTIRVESKVGEGSTFSFTLPVPSAATRAAAPEPAPPPPAEPPPSGPPRDEERGRTDAEPPPGQRPRFRIIRR